MKAIHVLNETNPKIIVKVAALAGQIMLEAHAESYRVEDTVTRILKASGWQTTEVVSTTTALYLTLADSLRDEEPITLVRRITTRGNQLNKIYLVNQISREVTSGEISFDEAYAKLKEVDGDEYAVYSVDIATALLVVGFTILLGGNVMDIVISLFAGIVVALTRLGKEFINMNDFIYGMFSTMITSFIISLIVYLLPYQNINQHTIIIATFMPLYPGTAFMNGIRDTLKGDYMSATARLLDAVVIAMSLALGVAIGLALFNGVMSWI